MKKILAKIRNKKLKGNISLLVILILLASSVISLLSINQIQRLITYWNQTFNYFRAFYLAKAWTELWLTEVYNSENGFNHSIPSDNSIVQDNLIWIYTGFNPYFKMTITWSFSTLTNDIRNPDCSWNKIRLTTWAWIMLSLFSDDTGKDWNLNQILSEDYMEITKLSNYTQLLLDWNNSELTFALFAYDKDKNGFEYMSDIVVHTWTSLNSFFDKDDVKSFITQNDNINKKYLTIKNSWTDDVEFCIKMDDNLIPYSDFLITVFWHYGDVEVWIQSVVKKWVPDWTLNVLDELPGSN